MFKSEILSICISPFLSDVPSGPNFVKPKVSAISIFVTIGIMTNFYKSSWRILTQNELYIKSLLIVDQSSMYLLKGTHHILEKQGENVQSARIIRFTSVDRIVELSSIIKEYIIEAIAIEESGVKVEFKKDIEPVPSELEDKFDELPSLRDAFYALTPGKRRGYVIYISQPKGSEARFSRIEKCIDKIMNGEGFHDHYKSKK